MKLKEIIKIGMHNNSSDIHIGKDLPPIYRIDGKLVSIIDTKLSSSNIVDIVTEIIEADEYNQFLEKKEMDLSYTIEDICRCRINIFLDRGNISMAIRLIPFVIPNYKILNLPLIVEDIAELNKGLVLIAGPTNSGKTTTLSIIIDLINRNKSSHIITIEDPIEYLHEHNKCIINQREIGKDTNDFLSAIRAAMRQDPDVIAIGEMRDAETISAAINAAETGHLVLSTIHTESTTSTISRIIDTFPPEKQNQIRTRLAEVLNIIISQKLIIRKDTGRIIATEVMVSNNAIKNMIRENKIHQISNTLQTGNRTKMMTMDQSLIGLYNRKLIDDTILFRNGIDKDYINKFIKR